MISIGAGGGWNSSQARRHFLLQTRLNLEMTDPEVRGDIDGFVLGSMLPRTLSTYGSLKLSQLLDMYYTAKVRVTDRGVSYFTCVYLCLCVSICSHVRR